MKIAVVVERLDGRGGCERSTAQIVRELTDRGHRVTVITGYHPDGDDWPGIQIDRLAAHRSRLPLQWLRFVQWAKHRLETQDFDVSLSMTTTVPAHVVQPRGGTIRETLARNLQMRSGLRSRLMKRIQLATSFKYQACLKLESATIHDPRVKRFVAVSRYVADQLQRHYEVSDSRIEVIPNAAEMPRVTAEQQDQWRAMIRRGFHIPPEAVVYLFSAFNPRLKGIDALFDATERLVESGLSPVVLLAGPIGYGYQKRAAELGIRDQVRFVGVTDQMPQLYAAADVTVLPTFYDPSSKVVIESLMMGTPAISTRYNGASDFISDPEHGRVRGRVIEDPADVDSLVEAMADLADPTERQACVAAMDGLEDLLSMRRHVDRLESVLDEVAGDGHR